MRQVKVYRGFGEHGEGLFLPPSIARAIEAEVHEAEAKADAQAVAEVAQERADKEQKRTNAASTKDDWLEPFENERNRHQILQRAQVAALDRGNDKTVDSDLRKRNEKLSKTIRAKGQFRKLATIPLEWEKGLDTLERELPNFAEVVASLRSSFAIARVTDGTIRFDPLVLDGPPGCGKSRFASRLAKFLRTPMKRVNMEAQQSGSAISGSDDFWANSKTGAVFELLVEGDVANPIIFVDEIEKAGGDQRYDPLGGFYCVLERETARHFRDLSVPSLELDASRVLWICTSNDIMRAPEPIRSRLRVFRIPAPTPDQARVIAQTAYREILNEVALKGFRRLGDDILDALANLSPREMRKTLFEALGNAVSNKRRHLRLNDLPAALKAVDTPIPAVRPTSLRGFAWRPRSLCLFIDVPGVLHPWSPGDLETHSVGVTPQGPPKLLYAQVLREILERREEVALVLTNGHRYEYPFQVLQSLLGPGLGERLIGLTPYLKAPRAAEIAHYVAEHVVARWIAIDDETVAWPSGMLDRVVRTDSKKGLGCATAVARLQELLARFGDH